LDRHTKILPPSVLSFFFWSNLAVVLAGFYFSSESDRFLFFRTHRERLGSFFPQSLLPLSNPDTQEGRSILRRGKFKGQVGAV